MSGCDSLFPHQPGCFKEKDPASPLSLKPYYVWYIVYAKNHLLKELKSFLHHLVYTFCLRKNIYFMSAKIFTQKYVSSLHSVFFFI